MSRGQGVDTDGLDTLDCIVPCFVKAWSYNNPIVRKLSLRRPIRSATVIGWLAIASLPSSRLQRRRYCGTHPGYQNYAADALQLGEQLA